MDSSTICHVMVRIIPSVYYRNLDITIIVVITHIEKPLVKASKHQGTPHLVYPSVGKNYKVITK